MKDFTWSINEDRKTLIDNEILNDFSLPSNTEPIIRHYGDKLEINIVRNVLNYWNLTNKSIIMKKTIITDLFKKWDSRGMKGLLTVIRFRKNIIPVKYCCHHQ